MLGNRLQFDKIASLVNMLRCMFVKMLSSRDNKTISKHANFLLTKVVPIIKCPSAIFG